MFLTMSWKWILSSYSVHLLNKDVLNKDNLSLQKVTFDVHKIWSQEARSGLGVGLLGSGERTDPH